MSLVHVVIKKKCKKNWRTVWFSKTTNYDKGKALEKAMQELNYDLSWKIELHTSK